MAKPRTSIVFPNPETLAGIQALVDAGRAPSVSAYVAAAAARQLAADQSVAAFRAATGFEPTEADAADYADAAAFFGDVPAAQRAS